ncbi:MAG: formate hydrogenlyase [Gammaproteobacteria bacterium]|nr:MAG: formate hydrogenlyase [Gammaproteobacteria bacterium]
MTLLALPLQEQAVFVLAAMVLFTSFLLLAQTRLVTSIHTFAWQGGLVAAITALMAWSSDAPHLYLSAALTLGLKALLIPWMLHRLVRRVELDRHTESLAWPAATLLGGAGLVLFSYWVVLPIEHLELAATRNIVAISLSVVLLGMLLMVARRQIVQEVIGFMSIENGLFLGAVTTAHGMPLVVELGVAFDVLVAAILFGVFFLQIRESIESLDADRLDRLSEREPEA